MEFKDILKNLRSINNLSQEELGEKVGMKKSNISKYERGILEPGIDTIKRFACVFNVTTDYLLGQSSNNVAEIEPKYYITDSEKGAVLRSAHPGDEDIPMNGDYRISGIMAAQVKELPLSYRDYRNYLSTRDETLKEWDEVIEKAITSGIKPEYVKQFIETQVSLAEDMAKKRPS